MADYQPISSLASGALYFRGDGGNMLFQPPQAAGSNTASGIGVNQQQTVEIFDLEGSSGAAVVKALTEESIAFYSRGAIDLRSSTHNIRMYSLARPALEPEVAAALEGNMVMAKPNDDVSFSKFQWVVSGLLAIIAIIAGFAFNALTGDISDLKTTSRDTTKAIEAMHVDITQQIGSIRTDLVGAIGGVKEEIATSNGKIDTTNAKLDATNKALDQLVQEGAAQSTKRR